MPGLAQCLLKPSLSRKFLQYSSGLHRGEISTFYILAHHSAIFLCFWNVEIDDSLVGQLTRNIVASLVGQLTSMHAKSRKMPVHKMSLQPLTYQKNNYFIFLE